MPTWELLICTKAIGTFLKWLTELFHILGNIEHYFLVNNFHLFFHTAYQGLPANADVLPVVDYLLLCCFVVFLSLLLATQPEIHLRSGYSAVCEHDVHIWWWHSLITVGPSLTGESMTPITQFLKRRGGSGSLPFFSGQLSSQPRPQGLFVFQYGGGGCKPIRAHVYMHQEMHQSATVLVRCVPRSSLLPPPYLKTRRTWGRG